MIRKIFTVLLIVILGLSVFGCGTGNEKTSAPAPSPAKIMELNVAAAPGPASYALAYMAENPELLGANIKLNLAPWKTYDQLLSMLTAKSVHIAGTPINNAIMMYNKGFDVKLLSISNWGMLYVVSADEKIKKISDLKGCEISITGKSGLHGLVFNHLLISNGLDPEKDVKLIEMDLPTSSLKLVSGEIKYAVLNEPNSSMAIMGAKKQGVSLNRVINLQSEWSALTGNQKARIPQAGFVAVNDSGIDQATITQFLDAYSKAAQWINDNPDKIGPIVEKHFENMKAPAVQDSLQYANITPIPAKECQGEVDAFLAELIKTAPPQALGGKIPDAAFYYQD